MGITGCGNNVIPNIRLRLVKNIGDSKDEVIKVLSLKKWLMDTQLFNQLTLTRF